MGRADLLMTGLPVSWTNRKTLVGYGEHGDLYPGIVLSNYQVSMATTVRNCGLGLQMMVLETETTDEPNVDMAATRRAWRQWMETPPSYNWKATRKEWASDMKKAGSGAPDMTAKIQK